MDLDDEEYVKGFPYVLKCGSMLAMTAREVSSKKMMVSDVQAKRWVCVVPIEMKPGPGNTYEKVAHAFISVVGSLGYLPDPSNDMLVSKDENIKENDP